MYISEEQTKFIIPHKIEIQQYLLPLTLGEVAKRSFDGEGKQTTQTGFQPAFNFCYVFYVDLFFLLSEDDTCNHACYNDNRRSSNADDCGGGEAADCAALSFGFCRTLECTVFNAQ